MDINSYLYCHIRDIAINLMKPVIYNTEGGVKIMGLKGGETVPLFCPHIICTML